MYRRDLFQLIAQHLPYTSCVFIGRTLCTVQQPEKKMTGRQRNFTTCALLSYTSSSIHYEHVLINFKCTFYLNLRQCCIFLTKYDLSVYSMETAISISRTKPK